MNTRTLLRIRKSLAALGVLSILSTLVVFAPVASAYSGADAPSWAKDAVDQACDRGLIDCDLEPKFTETANRAVAYQMLTKGFEVWNESSGTTFTDFELDDWFAVSASSAQTLEWTAGKDGEGVLFEGGKPMTRAMVAVAVSQILGLESADESVLDKYTDKNDVPDWATDAVASAVEAGLLGGGGVTKLRPNDGISKVEITVVLNATVTYSSDNEIDVLEVAAERMGVDAALVQEALDTGMFVVNGELVAPDGAPVEEEEPPPVEEEEPSVASPGVLMASVSSMTPAAGVLADGTAYNKMLTVTFSSDSDVDVTGVKVHHDGISTDANIAGVLVQDGMGARHGNVVTFSEKVAEITFTGDPIKVKAGVPMEMTVLMNFGGGLDSSTVGASIQAVADITSNASSVEGSFPLVGNVMTTVNGAASIGSLDPDIVVIGNAARSVDIGVKGQEITRFALAVGANEHVFVNKLVAYNNGNATDGDVTNLQLKHLGTGDVLATLEKTTSKNAVFDLSAKPFKIEKGRTETVQIFADVASGSTRTVQFRILNDYDLEVYGESGAGILAATGGAGTDTAFPIGDDNGGANAATINSITIGGGTLLVSRDPASLSGNISQGAKNQIMGVWKLEATGEQIEVRKICFDLDTGGTVTNENDAYSGTVKIQKSNGSSVYSFSPAAQTNNVDGTCTEVTLNSYFTIPANGTETLSIVTDILSTLANNTSLTTEFAVNEYKRTDTKDIVTGGGNANALASNALVVQASSLSVTSNPSYLSQTIVSGSPKTKIGSLVLQAGSAEGLAVQSVSVTLDNDGTRDATDTDTLVGITNLRICKADSNCAALDDLYATTIANPSNAAAGNSFTTSGKLNLAASGTVKIDIHADLSTTAPGGNSTLTPYMQIGSVTYVGQVSNTSNSANPIALAALQTMTITPTGTLTVTTPIQSAQRVLHANETNVELLAMNLASRFETVTIDKMVLTAVNGGGNLNNLTLKDGAGTILKKEVDLVSNKATFTGFTLPVPKDTTVTVKVYANTTGSGVMGSAQNVELRLGSFDARGQNSNTPFIESSHLTETLVASAASAGHYVRGDVLLKSEGAGAVATNGLVTANVEEDANLVTSTSLAGLGARAAADVLAKVTPTATGTTTLANPTVSSIAMVTGDVVMVALDNAAYQWGIVQGANSAAGAATTAMGLEGAAPANLNVATAGSISKFTPTATSVVTSASPPLLTQGMTFVAGDVLFGPTAANVTTHGWYVVTVAQTVGAGAGCNGGALRVNGAANWVGLCANSSAASQVSKFTPITTETVTTAGTTTAANGYNTGDIVYVFDGTDGGGDSTLDAGDGLYVVKTPLQQGATWTATGALGIGVTLANGAQVSKVFSTTTAPKSKVHVVHDSEPVIVKSATALSSEKVQQALQDVAIFDITASGSKNVFISAMSIFCTGAGSTNTELPDNAMEVKVDGQIVASSVENAATCATGNGRAHAFAFPVEITAGTTKSFLVRMDTAADAGQWATGESLIIRLAGTAGQTGGGVSWYYSAPESPGTPPSNGTPATITDSYPVDGPAITF